MLVASLETPPRGCPDAASGPVQSLRSCGPALSIRGRPRPCFWCHSPVQRPAAQVALVGVSESGFQVLVWLQGPPHSGCSQGHRRPLRSLSLFPSSSGSRVTLLLFGWHEAHLPLGGGRESSSAPFQTSPPPHQQIGPLLSCLEGGDGEALAEPLFWGTPRALVSSVGSLSSTLLAQREAGRVSVAAPRGQKGGCFCCSLRAVPSTPSLWHQHAVCEGLRFDLIDSVLHMCVLSTPPRSLGDTDTQRGKHTPNIPTCTRLQKGALTKGVVLSSGLGQQSALSLHVPQGYREPVAKARASCAPGKKSRG